MGTHEFSPLRREQVAISGNREWLRREWKQHDDQSFIFGGRSGYGASFLGALLSIDNNAEAAEAQPMPGRRTCRDPHLHTHVIVPNRRARADGAMVSIDSKSLHHEAKAAGVIYQGGLGK